MPAQRTLLRLIQMQYVLVLIYRNFWRPKRIRELYSYFMLYAYT